MPTPEDGYAASRKSIVYSLDLLSSLMKPTSVVICKEIRTRFLQGRVVDELLGLGNPVEPASANVGIVEAAPVIVADFLWCYCFVIKTVIVVKRHERLEALLNH